MLLVKYGLIAFISVLLSGMILLVVKIPRNPLRLLLAFSGAFLFAISLLHLIPELYGAGEENHNHPLHSATETGIWILVGFLIQLLLEYISEGIEHGHVHLHAHEHEVNKHGHARIPLGVVSGLCLHSFLEGMPLGVETDDPKIFPPFLTGIVLHNIPIAIAFIGLLLHMGHSKPSAFLLLGLFAIMTPAGMLASNFIGDQLQGDLQPYFKIVTGIVVGIFLHISTTILFESTENHRFNAMKFATILLGVSAAWLITRA